MKKLRKSKKQIQV